jgi:periplasmic nitrate reductase NapD
MKPLPEAGPAELIDGDILSCVVQVKPGRGGEVAARLEALPGVEVHGGVEVDRLVVTIEDQAGHPAADRLGALNLVEGVINAILIYHCDGRALSADPRAAGG